ncbi:hypothetical protein NQ318_016606 [Aromia moschata]|uniref:DUF4817 domain-containing protein n=1 Tax=Aromia moschata TaxID=1265417 RepID=A0AAV8XYV9_9CUCU|nr:hypothetical protein NQ318_016606 [Aromia moschata]
MAEFIKSWTIKDCLFLVYQALNDVSAETLRNAWGKLIDRDMPRKNSCQDSTWKRAIYSINCPKSKEISLGDTNEWLQADSTEDTWRRLTDEEIIAAAQGYPKQDDSDTELHENENDGNNNYDVMPRHNLFTNSEMTDMVAIYAQQNFSERAAARSYADTYPNRRQPNRKLFSRLFS